MGRKRSAEDQGHDATANSQTRQRAPRDPAKAPYYLIVNLGQDSRPAVIVGCFPTIGQIRKFRRTYPDMATRLWGDYRVIQVRNVDSAALDRVVARNREPRTA